MTNTNEVVEALWTFKKVTKCKEMMTSSYKTWLESTTEVMNESKKWCLPITQNDATNARSFWKHDQKNLKTYFDAYEMWKPFNWKWPTTKILMYRVFQNGELMDKCKKWRMLLKNPSQFGFANFS
jgi:hypothetical protein